MAVLSERGNSDDRDRLHLDEIVRVRERADLHHRRGRSPGAEELLAHGPEVRTVAHVGDVGGDLDDAVERAAPGLDERPDRGEDRARLSLEVAAVFYAALRVVGDLPGREEQRLRARHLDALAVARRIVHAGPPVLLDLRHARLLSPRDHMSLSAPRRRSVPRRACRRWRSRTRASGSPTCCPDHSSGTGSASTRPELSRARSFCSAWTRRISGINGRTARKTIEISQKSSA